MRITQGMLSNNILRQIQASNEKIDVYQQQLASGKKITKPSQDPVVATMGISYRTAVTRIDQYQKNISQANMWMDNSDAALDQATQVMQRVRELTVEASNDSYTPDQRNNLGKEIDQLKQQMVTIANTKVNGKYLFNGNDTANPPVDPTTYQVTNNNKPVSMEINEGTKVAINVDPTTVFNPQNKNSIFTDLNNLEQALGTGDGKTIGGYLDKIDGHINDIIAARADLGARQNRIQMTSNRLDQQQTVATKVMSNNEDADFEKVYTELNTAEVVHKAALQVGARVMQPTLVDFLS